MDWGSLIMKNLPSIIGAGAEIAGTVGGAKAQQAGITASKEDLSTALSKSNEAAGNSLVESFPWAQWAEQQGLNYQDTALGNAVTAKGEALGASQDVRRQALSDSLNILESGRGEMNARLDPYSTAGGNALNALTQHTLGAKGGTPFTGVPQSAGTPAPSILGRANFTPSPMKTPAPTAPAPTSALPTGTGTPGGGNAIADVLSGKNVLAGQPGLGVEKSTGAGLAASLGGTAAGLGLGALAGPAIATATGASVGTVVPLVGTAVGALAGYLTGKFTRKGHEKETASNAANIIGTSIQNAAKGLKDGEITQQQFDDGVRGLWQEYSTFLSGNLKDTDVVAKSLASQSGYINQYLKSIGSTATVSSVEGDKWTQGGNAA